MLCKRYCKVIFKRLLINCTVNLFAHVITVKKSVIIEIKRYSQIQFHAWTTLNESEDQECSKVIDND